MRFIENLFKKEQSAENRLENESAGKLMLMGMLSASPHIFNDNWSDYKKRSEETFELIILSTLHILRKFREVIPSHYSAFEADLFMLIHIFAKQESIIDKLPCDFEDFLNSRFELYDEEFSSDYDEQVNLPVQTTYNLTMNPLEKDSGICEDLFKVMELQIKLNAYFKSLNITFDFMLSTKYSQ